MDVRLLSVYRGTIWHVVAFEVDDECPTKTYLEYAEEKNRKERDRLMARIKMVADVPQFRNREIFNHEGDGIFVFKTHADGLRLYCFYDEGRLIVTVNGVDKPKKKQQQKDIAAARKWRDRYNNAKKAVAGIKIHL